MDDQDQDVLPRHSTGDGFEVHHRLLLATETSAALHQSALRLRLQATVTWLDSLEQTPSSSRRAGPRQGAADVGHPTDRLAKALAEEAALSRRSLTRRARGRGPAPEPPSG